MADQRGAMAGLAGAALLAVCVGSAAQAAPTAAKETPAPSVSGVTVTAPEKPNALVDRTTEFVRQRLPQNRNEQYARFRDPICVKVVGLPAEFDAFVAARIVAVARQVNAPVARPGECAPNVNVVFSPTPQAQVDDIYRRRDLLLGFRFHSQVKRMTAFGRPIQAWYLTRTRDGTGASILEVENGLVSWAEKPAGRAGSRLGNEMSSELVHSLIIADANKVAGAKIDAVADYIAVLALSRWQGLERCSGLPTILDLMADGCDARDRPEAATPADLALLTGLYSADVRETGALQRATIASAIRKAAASDGAAH